MSKMLDLTGYSLEVVGRELRMKPNADGYAAAFTWAFLMALLLVIQWWSFGESADPRRVAFNNLSAEKQAEFFQAGADAKREVELMQEQMSELQANSLRGKKVSPVVMEKIMNLNTDLIQAKKKSQKFVVPELPPPRPISAMVYRSCQVLFISLALLPFAILPFIRPTVVYEGLPGEGVFVVTLIPLVWRYRQGVIGFHAITPAVKREVRFSGRGSERQFHDVGFLWMIRLTPQPVTSLEIGDHEFRIILKLMPDKGMVRDQLPMYVRTPLRFFEGVTGLIHDRILVEDTVNVNTALGTMTTRTEVIHTGSS